MDNSSDPSVLKIPRVRYKKVELSTTRKSSKPDVMIEPKKLVNPIKESPAMQNIHKELMLNQKIGRTVLNHKTELQKALEKVHGTAPAAPPSSSTQKNEFQKKLDARAKLIEDQKWFVDGKQTNPFTQESEFQIIHKKINKHDNDQ